MEMASSKKIFPDFEINDTTLIKYNGLEKEIIIPEGITEIGSYSFANSYSVESIIIPEGVECIRKSAFAYCENLKEITIPKSINRIEEGAFLYCVRLKNIYYEGTIGDWCNMRFVPSLLGCSTPMKYAKHFYLKNEGKWEEIKSIEIPNGIIKIEPFLFYGFKEVTTIIIPDSVTSIGDCAFSNCEKLETITIPKSVTRVNGSAFMECPTRRTKKRFKTTQGRKKKKNLNVIFFILV